MTDAVIDTVALIHHLNDTLPKRAAEIFRSAEHAGGSLFLPEVAMGEFAYLALRGKLGIDHPRAVVDEVLDQVRAGGYIRLSSLGPGGWSVFLDLPVPELHDRMIVSDALSRNVPLISNDPEMKGLSGLRVVWA